MMKKICLLCVLLHICLAQGDISNSLDQEIQEVKISAENVVDNLLSLKTILNNVTVNSLENCNDKINQKTNSKINYLLEEIDKAVNAVKAQEKDAYICLKNAKNSFQNAIFDKEKKNATSYFKPVMDPVETDMKQAVNITYELDMVNLLCFSLNSTEHTDCVNERLNVYRTIVDDLKKRHELRQLQEEKLVSDARRTYQSFCEEYEKNIETMIGNIKLSASECVKNALNSPKTTTIQPFGYQQPHEYWKAIIENIH